MKLLVLLLLITSPVFACNNWIPMSEAQKAINLEPNAGSKLCSDLPDEECLCYDGVDFEIAIIVEDYSNGDAKFKVNSQSSCENEDECKAKLADLKCDPGFEAKYRMDNPQVYCVKLEGFEQVKVGHKFAQDDSKAREKLERIERAEAAMLAKKERKENAKRELLSIDWSKITTIAQMKVIVQKILDKIEE